MLALLLTVNASLLYLVCDLDTSYKGLLEILIVIKLQNLRLSNDTVASLSTLDPATLLNYYTVPRRQHGQDLHGQPGQEQPC